MTRPVRSSIVKPAHMKYIRENGYKKINFGGNLIGVDIVFIPRISSIFVRFGSYFIDKILTKNEQNREITVEYLAGRWAAKEAVAKALGAGFSSECRILDIEIINESNGKPCVKIRGKPELQMQISISHDKDYAVAVVMVKLI